MPAGIRVYNDNGVLQTDAVFKNFSMIKKKTATYTRVVGGTINEDFSGQVLVNPSWAIYSTAGFIDGDIIYDFWDGPTDPLPTPKDKWWINRKMTANDPASMDVEWYVFDNPVLGTAGYGLRAWDDNGKLTYQTETKPLRIVDVITLGFSTSQPPSVQTFNYLTGKKYAVITAVQPCLYTSGGTPGQYNVQSFNGGVRFNYAGPSSGVGGQRGTYIVVDVTGY